MKRIEVLNTSSSVLPDSPAERGTAVTETVSAVGHAGRADGTCVMPGTVLSSVMGLDRHDIFVVK